MLALAHMPESLIDTARRTYSERGSHLSAYKIAQRMDCSEQWVRQFLRGRIPNPGVLTIEKFIRVVNELAAES